MRARSGHLKGYSIQKKNQPGNTTGHSYYLTVPQDVGEVVPGDVYFRFELVEDGILLRRVDPTVTPDPGLPEWVQR